MKQMGRNRRLTRPMTLTPSPETWPEWEQIGNSIGNVSPCGHNAKLPRRRRGSLGFADFKHYRNLFPMRRRWKTRRIQNPVLARGSGFKFRLRQKICKAKLTTGCPLNDVGVDRPSSTAASFGLVISAAISFCTPSRSIDSLLAECCRWECWLLGSETVISSPCERGRRFTPAQMNRCNPRGSLQGDAPV